jgi:hypothetical protein
MFLLDAKPADESLSLFVEEEERSVSGLERRRVTVGMMARSMGRETSRKGFVEKKGGGCYHLAPWNNHGTASLRVMPS